MADCDWTFPIYQRWPATRFNPNSAADTNQVPYVKYPQNEAQENVIYEQRALYTNELIQVYRWARAYA